MIIFRADGNIEIGSGHVMRCLSIAKEASKHNDVLFITADDYFKNSIEEAGIKNIALHTSFNRMISELQYMKKIVADYCPSILFIDSYFVTSLYLDTLHDICKMIGCKVVYIDDLLKFPYTCDFLINYNIYGPDKRVEYEHLYKNAKKKIPCLLLGTRYVPLRFEFQNLPRRIVNKNATEILISTGGSDPNHIALQVAEHLVYSENIQFTYHLIVSALNRDGIEIDKLVNTYSCRRIVIHSKVQCMSELMCMCDVALSAAGSTLYELCATQTPTLTYVVADNQIFGAEGFERHGLLKCVGDYRNNREIIADLIREGEVLAKNYDERVKMANDMRRIVSGNGAQEIIKSICNCSAAMSVS